MLSRPPENSTEECTLSLRKRNFREHYNLRSVAIRTDIDFEIRLDGSLPNVLLMASSERIWLDHGIVSRTKLESMFRGVRKATSKRHATYFG
jgi:hypothetical protein